jgi:hypothetical protein
LNAEVAGKSRDLGLTLSGGPGLDAIGQTVVPGWVGAVEEVVEHGGLEGRVGFEGLGPGAGNGSLNDGQDAAGDGLSLDWKVDIIQQVVGGDGGLGSRDSEGRRGEEEGGESFVLHDDGLLMKKFDGVQIRIVSEELLGMMEEGEDVN